MRMLRVAAIVLVVFALGCTQEDEYKMGRAELGLNFVAKNMCSCLWVAGMNETHCRDHARLEQVNPTVDVHPESRTVEATLFWIYEAKARFISDRVGCRSL